MLPLRRRWFPALPVLLKLPTFSSVYPSFFTHCHPHNAKLTFSSAATASRHSDNNILDFFDYFLQQCIIKLNNHVNFKNPVKQIHAQIIFTGSSWSAFLLARLISIYSMLDNLKYAQRVFSTAPQICFSNQLFWNSILRAYVMRYEYNDALEVYSEMRETCFQPDGFGFPLIIRACGMKGDAGLCRSVHCHIIKLGFGNNLHVNNELLVMYGKIGWMNVACQVFDRMPARTHVSWNSMVSGFASNHDWDGAYMMFSRMENEGWEPNSVTWTSLISSSSRCGLEDKTWEFYVSMKERGVSATAETLAVVLSVCSYSDADGLKKGGIVHGHVVAGGFQNYVFVSNTLISMYGKHGCIEEAENLFSGLESKNIVSWNALISSYAESGLCDEALAAFQRWERLDRDCSVRPNVVSWSAIINGFSQKGCHEESLELFRKMQFAKVFANAVTIASVLAVCAELSAACLGREIHAHVIRVLMDADLLVRNGLINMYMKCGSLSIGGLLFERMDYRDIISWNTMISGYGMHGLGEKALEVFYQMVNTGVKPDEVSFVAVLSACSHAGLIPQGRELYDQMTTEFNIKPQVEHYACMVDLYGRGGLLNEAGSILKSMPMEPNDSVWGALLNSCRMHKSKDIPEETAPQTFNRDYEATGSYMLLSNLFAASGRWEDSARVRLSAKAKGLKKIPGQSWIEVKKKVHSFSAGNDLNSGTEEVYDLVKDLTLQMTKEGCVPSTIFELPFADEEGYTY